MTLAWITLVVCAMSFALSFAHLMELPARISWAQQLWVDTTVFGGLYRSFAMPGALIVIGAVALSIALAVMRRSAAEGGWIIASALLYALGLAAWMLLVRPMNGHMAEWHAGAPIINFERVRAQWEYSHALIAGLTFAGFVCLARAALLMSRA